MLKSIKLLFFCFFMLFVVGLTQSFAGNITQGKIVETMNAGGYTYLSLEKDGQKGWAAIPETPVKVGEEVEIANGMVMNNFNSKSLGRTFDAILFSQGVINR